ncbi:MAG: HypC/HybG/HupF family hydrogenase formation chaperone [Anaerolineae bacterium]|nr:HypC/HybG/HupF family hydrogenase formation chaperone [Candidatus Roseilinea sp.]MDW8450118.1 HypC/HybG/HupF family hydrogenase formation chaperone [Anaerolineae bacterium]
MCLGIPGRVQEIYEANGVRMGKVNFGGVVKEVCLDYVPEIAVGDYTIVHVGFAITRIDEASAQESLRLFQELGMLEEELSPERHADSLAPPACPTDPWGRAAPVKDAR